MEVTKNVFHNYLTTFISKSYIKKITL